MSATNGSIRNGSSLLGSRQSEVVHGGNDGIAAAKKLRTATQFAQPNHELSGKTFKGRYQYLQRTIVLQRLVLGKDYCDIRAGLADKMLSFSSYVTLLSSNGAKF